MQCEYTIDGSLLAEKVKQLRGHKVLLVGDIMLDEYLNGDAERISPEAPIPVVRVESSRILLGGAGNVARNIVSLGGEVHMICMRGRDAKGAIVESTLQEEGIASSLLTSADRPTTLKTRVIARNQQMLRIDYEDSSPLPATDTAKLLELIAEVIEDYSVLVVSDYGKGVVSEALLTGLRQLRDASSTRPKILIDPKTPNFPHYYDVFILTPNTKETSEGAGMPARNPEEILAAGRAILKNLHSEHLLTTLGDKGMALFVSAEEVWHIPTAAQKVFDVTGAGDTVIATLALCLASGLTLLESCVLANYAAGIVVAEIGAGAVQNSALQTVLRKTVDPGISRWA